MPDRNLGDLGEHEYPSDAIAEAEECWPELMTEKIGTGGFLVLIYYLSIHLADFRLADAERHGATRIVTFGGGGGIRTHGGREPSLVFKTSAFDHSATPPFVSEIGRKG